MTTKALTASMDNVDAWRLGEIARRAGHPDRRDVGDPIDRGLILLRLLNECGYSVHRTDTPYRNTANVFEDDARAGIDPPRSRSQGEG